MKYDLNEMTPGGDMAVKQLNNDIVDVNLMFVQLNSAIKRMNEAYLQVEKLTKVKPEEIIVINGAGGILQDVFSTVKGLRLVVIDRSNNEIGENPVKPMMYLDPERIKQVKKLLEEEDKKNNG